MTQRKSHASMTPERAAQASEFLRKLQHGWRSDPRSVALAVGSILLTYALLARAIAVHELPAPLVVMPLLVEGLAILWIAPLLARTAVDCAAFGETARSFGSPIGWTLVAAVVLAALLAWDPATGRYDAGRTATAGAGMLEAILRSGVLWAVLAALAGLVVATLRELADWKRRGGVFFWGASVGGAFRVILGLVASPAVVATLFAADHEVAEWFDGIALLLNAWTSDAGTTVAAGSVVGIDPDRARAWMVFMYCLNVELGAMVVAYWVQRQVRARAARGGVPEGVVLPREP
jgi:hypothetical protein